MNLNLRSLVLAPAILAAAALATNVAVAETTLKVPFNFSVAGKTMPAGFYTVHRDSTGNIVSLRGRDAQHSFNWILAPGEPAPNDSRIVLRFDTDGQSHELRSIQYGPAITSRIDKKTVRQMESLAPGQ
jgi:hypothetical protein